MGKTTEKKDPNANRQQVSIRKEDYAIVLALLDRESVRVDLARDGRGCYICDVIARAVQLYKERMAQ